MVEANANEAAGKRDDRNKGNRAGEAARKAQQWGGGRSSERPPAGAHHDNDNDRAQDR